HYVFLLSPKPLCIPGTHPFVSHVPTAAGHGSGHVVGYQTQLFLSDSQRLLCLLAFCNVNAGTDVSGKRVFRTKEWNAPIEYPTIHAIMAPQPIFHLELFPVIKSSAIRIETSFKVAGMNAFIPTVSEFLLHCPASKIQPSLIEKRTKLVLAGKPDHHRRGVRQEMKESFTRLEGFCRALSFCDVASNLRSADYLSSRFFNRLDGERNH